ncbi:MAG: VWA domain-containing protein [Acidobacteria bacterium]|nr:VWA domain-containing protein [Acidobacteriota bacterium]MBV9145849.1 VWA domain-containing protein [Acidobacteriota bacterium]MBV9436698.1 VWA domain-containing protein [Acidobacteriota bacterium]
MRVRTQLHAQLLLLIVCCASAFAQTPTFRSDVNLVTLTFTVRDSAGRLVGNLSQSDVEVFDDAIPQKIRFFARSTDLPLTIGLVVDASDSQSKFIRRHRGDVEKFLRDVLGPKDQAFLVCFGNHLRLVSDLTSSTAQIMDNLEAFDHSKRSFPEIGPREIREEGTAFYDAIYYAVNEKLNITSQGHRALVVFSDGQDNSSAHHMLDAIEAAQHGDVLVYSIRYTEERRHLKARDKYGIRVMRRISRDTGAADFDATRGDLDQTFRDIGAELRALYEVGYHADGLTRDNSFHKVAVKVKSEGLTARSKAGYFAGTPEADVHPDER